jgi:glutamine amidotransferase
MPSLPVLHSYLRQLVQEVVEYDPGGTILNFLLTTGPHVLWVYSWPGRRPGSSTWNGLHYIVKNNSTAFLSDDDYRFDVVSLQDEDLAAATGAGGVAANGFHDAVATSFASSSNRPVEGGGNPYCIVATKPLTDDPDWIELQPGELILMDNGLPHVSVRDLFHVELQGHGLDNQGRAQIKPPRLEEDMRRFEFQPEFFSAGGI